MNHEPSRTTTSGDPRRAHRLLGGEVPDDLERRSPSWAWTRAIVEMQLTLQQDYGVTIPEADAHVMTTLRGRSTTSTAATRQRGRLMPARTDNSVIIDAPLDVVWDAMNDVERWPSLFSGTPTRRSSSATATASASAHDPPDEEHGGRWSWVSERTADPATHTSRAPSGSRPVRSSTCASNVLRRRSRRDRCAGCSRSR